MSEATYPTLTAYFIATGEEGRVRRRLIVRKQVSHEITVTERRSNLTESIASFGGRWVSIYQEEIAVSRVKSEEAGANYPGGDKNVFFDNPRRSMTATTTTTF